ncbi:hypothetical protein SISSUDRAFT_517287 [Sistotremastrum suecicum HHB10207 ss-3]|uniref:Uncharacterized protein n=1 Tax=Sistotremastrum suecicum HHB10207 ss-3 TaxID=1314776 RepID=A0A166F8V5_9AGAM|nr:hypothetical protein SISSUDRAFT_517287 [Sistotremastrum suecicum HHB10207 ss-3]
MSTLDAETVSALESYVNEHALPDDGGYLVLEQPIGITVPFKWELFPFRIIGSYDKGNLSIKADAQVFVPIKGWTTIYHFSGSLTEGITAIIDTPIAKGIVTVKAEEWNGGKWFTVIVKLWIIGGSNIDKTIHVFKIPPIHSQEEEEAVANAVALGNPDLNTQWLEHLHLFSKLVLENGGAAGAPLVAATA